MTRTIGTRKAHLLRAGIILAVEDWCQGNRSRLRLTHPHTVKAYARTLARVRSAEVAAIRYTMGKLADQQTLAHLDRELDQRNGL